ncbi:Maf family protein [Acinetobacter rudis]|uniref:Nucleoside triphosphate pyrophosphatase n=1 Tax=Acinetobacter rudis TaxID=632955 RepID=A0AAW8JCM8_9GAMM|nr:Maf family protein [Acinetobacter rudis]MDQ8936840.1 Maf family protein [Acinetobacter rudis]MDQ9019060.1 Maf family protein [Acinetobacter rudis]
MMYSEIILASSSSTRRELMDRLGIVYRCVSPDIDESPCDDTHAEELALRLAIKKAQHVAQQFPNALVIGSDQVAYLNDATSQFIGKPLTEAGAIAQLTAQSGQCVNFATALSVQIGQQQFQVDWVEKFSVQFRTLQHDEIERYVAKEQPLHCAGSFKCEGLGISLFESIQGHDQTSLMGLPLIALCKILRQLDLQLP